MDFAFLSDGSKLLRVFDGDYFKRDYVRGICYLADASFEKNKIIYTDKLLLCVESCIGGCLSCDALNEGNYGDIC